jgi:N-acetylglucosaminyldiphosphoundecaprenol N-acetyl-beta-D-mannosaminyltransferase
MKTIHLMGHSIYIDTLDKLLISGNSKKIINTINPHSYVVSKKDEVYKTALKESDYLLPDGVGIVLAAKLINKINIIKVSGSDLHLHTLKKLNKDHGSIFYMGSSELTLKKIKCKLLNDFPNIKVGYYSPPYKPVLTNEDNVFIINKINSFKPDVLFVGMTAPKQEKWLYENKSKLDFKFASCIGAVFDFYAETVKRPSKFWINLNFEWLIRFIREPRRLFKRNFISTPLFIIDLILFKLHIKR